MSRSVEYCGRCGGRTEEQQGGAAAGQAAVHDAAEGEVDAPVPPLVDVELLRPVPAPVRHRPARPRPGPVTGPLPPPCGPGPPDTPQPARARRCQGVRGGEWRRQGGRSDRQRRRAAARTRAPPPWVLRAMY